MPTYRTEIKTLHRTAYKALESIICKREPLKIDEEGNPYSTGKIRLGINERVNLLNLKLLIENMLENCKDDGY